MAQARRQRRPGGFGVAQVVELLEQREVQLRRFGMGFGIAGQHFAQAGHVVVFGRGARQRGQGGVCTGVVGRGGQAGFQLFVGRRDVAGAAFGIAEREAQLGGVHALLAGAAQQRRGAGEEAVLGHHAAEAHQQAGVGARGHGRVVHAVQRRSHFAHVEQQAAQGFEQRRVGFAGVERGQRVAHGGAHLPGFQRDRAQPQVGRQHPVRVGQQGVVFTACGLGLARGPEFFGTFPAFNRRGGGHARTLPRPR